MTSENPTLFDRFQQFPRAVQWALFAGLFLVLFLAWSDLLGPVATRWTSKADSIESELNEVRNADRLVGQLKAKRQAIVALGEVALPQSAMVGGQAMTAAVVDVLHEFSGIRDDNFNLSASGRRLPKIISNKLVAAVPGSKGSLIQLTGDLSFEAPPETTIDIIAAFEARPEIVAVSLVRIQKGDRGRLRVSLTLESWAFES